MKQKVDLSTEKRQQYIDQLMQCSGWAQSIIDRMVKQWPMRMDEFISFDAAQKALRRLELDGLNFDEWPQTPGITFASFARGSAKELAGAFVAKFARCINTAEPRDMLHRLVTPRGQMVTEDQLTDWMTSAQLNIYREFNLQEPDIFLRDLSAMNLKFAAERDAFFSNASARPACSSGWQIENGQAFWAGKNLNIPSGQPLEILEKLVEKSPHAVPYNELDNASVNSASDALRKNKNILQKILKRTKTPFFIQPVRTFGYGLTPTKRRTIK